MEWNYSLCLDVVQKRKESKVHFFKNLFSKTIVKNGIWMYLLQFFNMVIPLLTLPYVTRILGTSQYGVFSSAFNIVGYAQVIVEYGFIMSASRKVALLSTDEVDEDLDQVFSNVLCGRSILFFMCAIVLWIFVSLNKFSQIQVYSYILLSVSLIGIVFQVDWLFQGKQDMKFISLTNIIARSVSTLLIFLTVKKSQDVLVYCLLYASSPLISNGIGIVIAKKRYHLKFVKTSLNQVLQEMKSGWYVFTTQFTSQVFGSAGVTFLVFWSNSAIVGGFSAIQKIPNVVLMLWLPISQVIYPVVSKKMEVNLQVGINYVLRLRRLLLSFFGIIIIAMIFLSRYLVLIAFGSSFVQYSGWLIPLLMWAFISIDNGLLGVQILLGSGHDKEYSTCFLISVIVTVVSSATLVFFFKGWGASIAPLISEGTLDILLLYEVARLRRIK